MLSLGGVYQQSKYSENNSIPLNIQEFLNKNPNVNEIFLHLDNRTS